MSMVKCYQQMFQVLTRLLRNYVTRCNEEGRNTVHSEDCIQLAANMPAT